MMAAPPKIVVKKLLAVERFRDDRTGRYFGRTIVEHDGEQWDLILRTRRAIKEAEDASGPDQFLHLGPCRMIRYPEDVPDLEGCIEACRIVETEWRPSEEEKAEWARAEAEDRAVVEAVKGRLAALESSLATASPVAPEARAATLATFGEELRQAVNTALLNWDDAVGMMTRAASSLGASPDEATAIGKAWFSSPRKFDGKPLPVWTAPKDDNDPLRSFSFDGDAPPAPVKMLVKRLLSTTGIAFVGGQSGAGKTFVVIDLAVSLASGEAFFGHKVVERVGVAILAGEGAATIGPRLEAARGKAHGEILPISWTGQVGDLSKMETAREMVKRLKAVDERFRRDHGARLGAIILDTLAACYGMKDENDNAEASRAISMLKALGQALDVVVIPVAHYGKAAETGLRGASAWRAGADTVLTVAADRNQVSGKCANRRLALTKSRTGEEGWNAEFELEFVPLGTDEDGETTGACRVIMGEASASGLARKPARQRPGRDASAYVEAVGVLLGEGKRIRPFGADGTEVVAVDREAVRAEFYASRPPADGEDEKRRAASRRQSFNRGEAAAMDRGLIAGREVDGAFYVWPLGESTGPHSDIASDMLEDG